MILSTDMTQHKEILETFQSRLENFDFENTEDALSLKKILIKACDISNEIRLDKYCHDSLCHKSD